MHVTVAVRLSMLGKRATLRKHVGNGGNKIERVRKDGIAEADGGSRIDKHGSIESNHGRTGGNASYSAAAAAASASASASGGIGEPDRSTSVGIGRSKWERFDRVDGTDSSEEKGIEGKGRVKGLAKHIEQVVALHSRHVLGSSSSSAAPPDPSSVASLDKPLTTMMKTTM